MKFSLILMLFLLMLGEICNAFRKQIYKVKGRLLCGTEPAANVQIKLYEFDTMTPDDLLKEGKTNSDGRFEFGQTSTETTTLMPYLKLFHNCDIASSDTENCPRREWIIGLPQKYISAGTFNIGEWNLEIRQADEEC